MATLVKTQLQTSIVEGIYNDIITRNVNYYYFLGRTSVWNSTDGATNGIDGVTQQVTINGSTSLSVVEPTPVSTQKYEQQVRNDIIMYKSVKPSDISFIIPRIVWKLDTIYDMYDDAYSYSNLAYSGAADLKAAQFYVLTSNNNVYKCISNNYDSKSLYEPTGTNIAEFELADGYIWKFMYQIPAALQHKFYTWDYIPVMTALKDRFYENGKILNVAVQDTGSNYTSNVQLIVSGDGFLEDNPYALSKTLIIANGGNGYKPTLETSAVTWTSGVVTFNFATDHGYIANDKISVESLNSPNYSGYYTVIDAPTTTSLRCTLINNPGAWTGPTTVSKDIITISAPLWGAGKIQAKAHSIVDSTGTFTLVELRQITDPTGATGYGYGYDDTVSMTIDTPFPDAIDWLPNITYTNLTQIKAGNNFYITNAGTGNTTIPTHLTGDVVHGTVTYTYIGTLAEISIIKSKTEALMTPIVQGAAITGVTIVDGGIGYTYCNISTYDTPTNTSAILTADIAIGDVDTIQANVELSAVDGAISYIKIEKDELGRYINGSGYGVDTTIQITGDGVGATAEPVIVNGSIVSINLLTPGYGYTKEAIVTILPEKIDLSGTDYGAKARAIISPIGGHGKNAIKEFNASNIMLFTSLADERLFKLKNLNDYRQFGIIKNPKRYGLTSRVTTTLDTACFLLISGTTIDITKFRSDDELYQSNGARFRIITIDADRMVVQNLNNYPPISGNAINSNPIRLNETLNISTIVNPGVDKYTGDMMFIENKLPFVVTADQVVAFRTIIGF